MKARLSLVFFALCFISQPLHAQNALLDFSANLNSFSAQFVQVVYDSDSVALQESAGSVDLERPGRFRWTYTEPADQVIVADGVSLWVYDEDIQQVTVQPQSATLGSAPIGLLSGQISIESEFEIAELGVEDGLMWFELTPIVQDTDFNTVYIALKDGNLQAMELRDNFDQATQIKFTDFQKNIAIEPAQFRFIPPENTDIVGEMGVPGQLNTAPREVGDDEVVEGADVKNATLPDAVTEEPVDEEPKTVIDGNSLQIEEQVISE